MFEKKTPWHSDKHGGAFLLFFVKNPNENKIKCFFIVKVNLGKVEKFLKGSLDIILSPSPSVKIQIMG